MIRLAQITDIHLDDELSRHYRIDAAARLERVLDDVAAKGVRDAVVTGDCGDDAASMSRIEAAARERGIACLFALGNHDRLDWLADRADYAGRALGSKLAYEASVGGADFLVLDSSSHFIDGAQLAKLDAFVSGRDGAVVFCHHPVLDCGGTFMDGAFPLSNRDEVRALLAGSGRRVHWFCGHYHNEYCIAEGLVVQYVTTASSVRLKADSDRLEMDGDAFGYRLIDIDGANVSSETVWLS